jgi:F0F1-type ATP synthase assembly protein I
MCSRYSIQAHANTKPNYSNHLDTLILSAYLSLFMFFSSCTFLGTDEKEWIDAFALSAKSTPRYKLLATQVTCTLVGALIGSAGHLLDWEKAWQVYPVPPILGSCLGLIAGNGIGFFSYYRAVSSTSRRVELRASSASASSKGKNKSNKKKKR